MTAEEDRFTRRAREALQQEVESLDAATLSKLNQARQAALADKPAGTSSGLGGWLPASGLALASILVVMVFGDAPNDVVDLPDSASVTDGSSLAPSDLEVLLADESLEMLEDLDFYTWMEAASLDDSRDVFSDDGSVG